jgi:hypothetical protein
MNIDAITAALNEALTRLNDSPPAIANNTELPPDIRDSLINQKLSEHVTDVLAQQPEFSADRTLMISTGDGGLSGFQIHVVAPRLVREARRRQSAQAAAAWLDKVLSTTSVPAIFVQTIWGIVPPKPIQLFDDIEIVPFSALPPSYQHQQLCDAGFIFSSPLGIPSFLWRPPSAALISSVEVSPFIVDRSQPRQSMATDQITDRHERMYDTRLCLALEGTAMAIPGPTWFQFSDADLQAAVIGASTGHLVQEIVPISLPADHVLDVEAAVGLVRSYFQLDQGLRRRVRTAIERLHQGLARRSPADQVVELSIALETLLVDSPGEHI